MTSPESPARGLPPSAGEAMLSPAMDLSTRLQHRQTMQEERLADIEKMSDKDKAKFYNRVKLWWGSYSIEFRELLVFILFLVVYTNVMWGPKGIALDRFMLKSAMARNIHPSFTRISTVSAWYNWLELELVPNLYSNEATKADPYAAVEWPKKTHFDAAGVNRRIGTVRVRLLRAKNRVDLVSPALQSSMGAMYPDLSYETYMDTTPYALNMSGLGLEHADFQELKWRSGIELGNRGFTYCPGTGYEYSPSGYVVDFPPRLENATRFVQQLRANSLVDLATRAALVEYAVYNANTDEFGVATLVLQIPATGGVFPEAVVKVAPLLGTFRTLNGDPPDLVWVNLTFLEMALYGLVVFLALREVSTYRALGHASYSRDGWAWMDLVNYGLFLLVAGLRANLVYNLWYLGDQLADDDGTEYVNLTKVATTYFLTESIQAFNCIVTFVKTFKYLRPIPKLALFTETLRLTAGDMQYMGLVLLLIFVGFGTAFTLGFGVEVAAFMTLGTSVMSLFRATLGDFDLDKLIQANYLLGPFLFVLFIFLVFFVVLSMFLSIVDESFDIVRTALEERREGRGGELEPLERDLIRFKGEVYSVIAAVLKKCPCPKLRKSAAVLPDPDKGDSATSPAREAFIAAGSGQAAAAPRTKSTKGGAPAAVSRVEASPVSLAIAQAFGASSKLGAQQAQLEKLAGKMDERVKKRIVTVAKAADDFRAIDGGGVKGKYA